MVKWWRDTSYVPGHLVNHKKLLRRILACVAGAWTTGHKKKRAREKETREGKGSSLTPRGSPSRAPVLSFAHYFQAPATQASRIPDCVPSMIYLFLILSLLLVVLESYSIVTILQLVGSSPLCRKWASLCCYTGNESARLTEAHLKPLIFIACGRRPTHFPVATIKSAIFCGIEK